MGSTAQAGSHSRELREVQCPRSPGGYVGGSKALLVASLLVWSRAAAAVLPCGTPERIHTFAGRTTVAGPVSPPEDHLTDHDPFSEEAQRATSIRFVLKWGSEHPLSDGQAAAILGHLESAYEDEVTAWDLADPTEFESTWFNVYIGDTGPEVPSAEGKGGYFTLDDWGFPYIVLNRSSVSDMVYMEGIVNHEFFHAVQWASGAFSLTMGQLWYWEATATWATGRLQPDNNFYFYFLPWYALRPTTALDHHSTEDYGGEPPDLHQYGAFIVPWYITEHLDGEEVILATWREGDAGEDPVDAMDTFLGDVEIEDVLADQAAANLTWDYAAGDRYAAHMNEVAGWYPHRDTRVTTAVAEEDDWWVHEDAAPGCYGYHFVQLPDAAIDRVRTGGELAIAVVPDVRAGLPSTLRFRGRLVEFGSGGVTRHWIDPDADQTWVDVSATATELWLAVVNTTPPHALRDTPAYRFRWVPLPEEPDDTGAPHDTGGEDTAEAPARSEEDTGAPVQRPNWGGDVDASPKGCACAAGGRGPGLIWLGAGLLLLRRRGDSQTG